ncbi:LACT-domain-containing protein [Linderina pennispora]|uniref:LACT-domain-containing protein n=1 Tax=Linderina pennispora TaxID=61395 RepID=A0A1Y1WBM1_9FUNG|nr:LACT-domain-containing protein [Linderina pennispora]ORX70646.1 LACT-domain-containing protein [Linderina pennispora]
MPPSDNDDSTALRRRRPAADNTPTSVPGTPTLPATPAEKESSTSLSAFLEPKRLSQRLSGGIKRMRRRWFLVGILVGALMAVGTILYTNPLQSEHIDRLSQFFDDLDIPGMIPDDLRSDVIKLLTPSELEMGGETYATGNFQPAQSVAGDEQLKKKHPVILVPGIISSGLESWSTENCSKPYFRQRMWGTATMFKALLMDKDCWVSSMMLDKKTGLDPPGYKLRAAKGLYAADYFITGYWIWAKLIENLAVLGYDSNDMFLASYDWRLSLKSRIELNKKGSGEKTVLVAHSMGSQIIQFFIKWVESPQGGDGGDHWVADHIEAMVNLAGTPLGVPKTLSSLLSGEQRETVQPLANMLLERFMNRYDMAKIFRSWPWPALAPSQGREPTELFNAKGDSWIPKDTPQFLSYGTQVNVDDGECKSLNLLMYVLDKDSERLMRRHYSYGVFRTQHDMDAHRDDYRMWTNPLQHQLPNAPNMTIYSFYGYGVETERAYFYTKDGETSEDGTPSLRIDKRVRPHLSNVDIGVVGSEGDGTVPLLSLGYMGASGWRKPLFNPHGVRVVTKECRHSPLAAYKDIRGGVGAADHINILGNYEVTLDILRIVSGYGGTISDRFTSNILDYAAKIDI